MNTKLSQGNYYLPQIEINGIIVFSSKKCFHQDIYFTHRTWIDIMKMQMVFAEIITCFIFNDFRQLNKSLAYTNTHKIVLV